MGFAVYILYSVRHERYYIGYSKDWSDRLKQHNSGNNKSTAPYAPWVVLLVFSESDPKGSDIVGTKAKESESSTSFKICGEIQVRAGTPGRSPGSRCRPRLMSRVGIPAGSRKKTWQSPGLFSVGSPRDFSFFIIVDDCRKFRVLCGHCELPVNQSTSQPFNNIPPYSTNMTSDFRG